MHTSCPCEECRKIVLGIVGASIVLMIFIFVAVFGYPAEDVSTYQQMCNDRFGLGAELVDLQISNDSIFMKCERAEYDMSWYVLNMTVVG